MDDLTAAALGADLSAPLPPAPRAGPGRPAISSDQRALNDQKYKEMLDVMDTMPQAAREPKFAVFRARRGSDTKKRFKPLVKISLSEWKDKQFNGSEGTAAQASYFTERWGPGRYVIEPIDALGNRITKLASWVVATHGLEEDNEMLDDDDFDDEDDDEYYSRRGRRRRRRYEDDEDFDDPRDRKMNLADFLVASSRTDQNAVGKVVDSSQNTLAILMHTSQQQEAVRREEAMRREEAERKRQEDQARRDEERRREERIAEDRRRDDLREQQRRDDAAREQANRVAIETSNKRMELMIGVATALLPKLFEKKDSPIEQALLASFTQKKETDPITLMIMKNFLDVKNTPTDPMGAVMSSMIEMQKMGNTLNIENTKQILALNSEVTKTLVTKILDNADEGGGNKNMLEQIMGVLGSASEMVSKLMPPATPAPTAYQQMAQQRQQQAQQQQQAKLAAPAPAAAQSAPAQPAAAPAQPVASANEMAVFEQAVRANPTLGVLSTLYGIHRKAYQSQEEYQGMVEYAVQAMPIALRVAVLDNNEAQVLQLVMPTVEMWDQLKAWTGEPGVIDWLREFIPQLAQPIEVIYGPAAKQRDEYVELLAKAQDPTAALVTEAAPAEVAPADVTATEEAPAPVAEATEAPGAPLDIATGEPKQDAPIPFPGAAPAEPGPVTVSHLDDPDAP